MIKSWNLSRNILVVLIYRILIVLFLFSLCRIGFYIFNLRMFPGIDVREFLSIMRGGLVFDISATVYTNMLFILMQILPFDFRYNNTYQKISNTFSLFQMDSCLQLTVQILSITGLFKRAAFDIFKTFERSRSY